MIKRHFTLFVTCFLLLCTGCVTAVTQDALHEADDIYRSEYLTFYGEIKKQLTHNRQDGRLSYREEEITTRYEAMITRIRQKFEEAGIPLNVWSLTGKSWGWSQKKEFQARYASLVNKLTTKFGKTYLEARPGAPQVTAAILLNRGWDISSVGKAVPTRNGKGYTQTFLINVLMCQSTSYMVQYEPNTKAFVFESSYLGKTKDPDARRAELAAINQNFSEARRYLRQSKTAPASLETFIQRQEEITQKYHLLAQGAQGGEEKVFNNIKATLDWLDSNKKWIKMLL